VARQLHARDRADLQVVDFMTAAEGVTTVDSTDLNFDQTVDAVIDVIEAARAAMAAAPSRGGTDD
jgi:cytidylate kinase